MHLPTLTLFVWVQILVGQPNLVKCKDAEKRDNKATSLQKRHSQSLLNESVFFYLTLLFYTCLRILVVYVVVYVNRL